ncbi:MAG: S1 RNA-binding domain-containing protein [Clostridia bacterium]|nr:S1 RNA-binding domain-containing protein [Clostridia bacterium]
MQNEEMTNRSDILTVDPDEVITPDDDRDHAVWQELHNAFRSKRILTGTLDAVEETPGGTNFAIVYFKEHRIAIPFEEMISLTEDERYGDMTRRQAKILGNMLGCEIDFIIKGIDQLSRSIIASRREAMEKKRRTYFLSNNSNGSYQIYEGRIVQARVIAVAEKVIRVEVFGVECSIYARDLSWDWVGDCHDLYNVGDKILVRVLQVEREEEQVRIKADVRSVQESDAREKLSRCKLQAKYAGTVTDVNNGTMYIRLSNGVNAIAHTCYDSRMPGKKDEVSFVLTKINAERNVAMGIVTRIIRQNG